MKYITECHHYHPIPNYTPGDNVARLYHSEIIDTGTAPDSFTAEEWADSHDYSYLSPEDAWLIIAVSFYRDDATPWRDAPLYLSNYVVK